MPTAEETFNLEIVTPWGERLMIQIVPPKPDLFVQIRRNFVSVWSA